MKPRRTSKRAQRRAEQPAPPKLFSVVSESTAGGPAITFAFVGDTFTADLAGARLRGEVTSGGAARLSLVDTDGVLLADVTVHPRAGVTLTDNVVAIGSGLLWSLARWKASTTP